METQALAATSQQLVLEILEGSADISVTTDKHDGGGFKVHKDDTLCVDPSSAQYKITTESDTVFVLKNH